ncbi:MAG: hypothetical protein JST42_17945 [Bacteroidetes bacterium]|nr:hypothetical protein [Bacteroidota bacterium]
MGSLETFLALEGNDFNRRRILTALREARDENAESKELTFNIFSLTIYPSRSQVVLVNDVVAEDPEVTLPMGEFEKIIEGTKKN